MSDRFLVFFLRHRDLALYQCVSDRQQHRSRIVNAVEERNIRGIAKWHKFRVFCPGGIEPALFRIGRGTNVMPDCRRVFEIGRRRRFCQYLIPAAELCQRQQGNRVEELYAGEFLDHLEPDVGGNLACRFDRNRAAAFHARGSPQEMNVVRVVGSRIKTLRITGGNIGFVYGRCQDVCRRRIRIAADTPVNV